MKTTALTRTFGIALSMSALVYLGACENKAYTPIDKLISDFDTQATKRTSHMTGAKRAVHEQRVRDEVEAEYEAPAGPTQIIPVSTNLSQNIEKSLERAVPRGPDCYDSKTPAAASLDCPQKPSAVKAQFFSFLVSQAWASLGSEGPSIPDRTITQSQLLAISEAQSPLWKSYRKLSRIHFFSNGDGPLFRNFDFVITFVNGQELWARGDSDISETCLFLENTFPKNGKEFFEAVEVGGKEKKLLQNPLRGKPCNATALEAYRVVNLSELSDTKKHAPQMVMLIAHGGSKNQSYILRAQVKGSEFDFMSELGKRFSDNPTSTNSGKVSK